MLCAYFLVFICGVNKISFDVDVFALKVCNGNLKQVSFLFFIRFSFCFVVLVVVANQSWFSNKTQKTEPSQFKD